MAWQLRLERLRDGSRNVCQLRASAPRSGDGRTILTKYACRLECTVQASPVLEQCNAHAALSLLL
jgi:hypothetical protein